MFEAAVGCGCTYPVTNDTVVSKLRNSLHIAIRYFSEAQSLPGTYPL